MLSSNFIHSFILFHISETIYLYGGWDGIKDLADMWSYHVPTRQWCCISKNTAEEVK